MLCCSRSNTFSYFGTTAFPFHISRVVGLGDSFIIMSAKLVSWFFEVCPLGNGSFDVFPVVGAVVYASFVWHLVCLFIKL